MNTSPDVSTATDAGPLSLLLVAGPGVGLPAVPVPATIDSVPDGVTFSTSLLAKSAMNTSPLPSLPTAAGSSSLLLVAGPGVGAPTTPVPASIDNVAGPVLVGVGVAATRRPSPL